MPPESATKLMRSEIVNPCQTASWYSGKLAPRIDRAAVSRSGPSVRMGSMPTSRQVTTSNALGSSMPRVGSRGGRRKSSRPRPENHMVNQAQRIRDAENPRDRRDRRQRELEPRRGARDERFGEKHFLRQETVQERHARHGAGRDKRDRGRDRHGMPQAATPLDVPRSRLLVDDA